MKPIFILAIAAIAATGIGAAQLNNVIELDVIGFGTGGDVIESQIENATISFWHERVQDEETGFYKNLITACEFHTDEPILPNSTLVCKLSDENGEIIAEGDVVLDPAYVPSTVLKIPIENHFGDQNATSVFAVHDVHIVLIDPKPVFDEQPVLDEPVS